MGKSSDVTELCLVIKKLDDKTIKVTGSKEVFNLAEDDPLRVLFEVAIDAMSEFIKEDGTLQ